MISAKKKYYKQINDYNQLVRAYNFNSDYCNTNELNNIKANLLKALSKFEFRLRVQGEGLIFRAKRNGVALDKSKMRHLEKMEMQLNSLIHNIQHNEVLTEACWKKSYIEEKLLGPFNWWQTTILLLILLLAVIITLMLS